MKVTIVFLLVLGVAVSTTWADCWWTGCQPENWAVVGCAQYGRAEQGKKACDADGVPGNKYNCCAGEGGRRGARSEFGQGLNNPRRPSNSPNEYYQING